MDFTLRRYAALAVLGLAAGLPGIGFGQQTDSECESCRPELTLKCLVRMDCEELACLYRSLPVGEMPCGDFTGRAIYKPGTLLTVPAAGAVRVLWQGKHIDCCQGIMINRVLGGKAVKAALFEGESWLDGQPSIVMDYAPYSKWSGRARDEVRQVRPGLYLGCMYIREKCGRRFSMFFAIEQIRRPCSPCDACESVH